MKQEKKVFSLVLLVVFARCAKEEHGELSKPDNKGSKKVLADWADIGINWKALTLNANFSERHLHTTTVFIDKLWVIAGFGGNIKKDVWVLE